MSATAGEGVKTERPRPAIAPVIAGVGVVVLCAARVSRLGSGMGDWDEGVYRASLDALVAGHRLFSEVYSSQPPAFLGGLEVVHRAFGGSLTADRAAVLLVSLTAIAAAWVLGRAQAGELGGAAAALLLALDPLWLRQSTLLMADAPAVALGAVGVALAAEAWRRRGRRGSVALAAGCGAVVAVGVLVKLLAVAAVPPVVVLLVAAGRRQVVAGATATAAALVAMLLPVLGAWRALLDQSVGLHLGSRGLDEGGLGYPPMARTLELEAPLALLAVAGLVLALRRRSGPVHLATVLWGLGAAVVVVAQHPLWPHHLSAAAPACCVLGATAVEAAWRSARRRVPILVAVAVGVAATAVVAWDTPPETSGTASPAGVAALRSAGCAGALVVTDDPYAAASAGLRLPAALVDTSGVRLRTEPVTTARIATVLGEDGVDCVVLATGRLAAVPGLQSWLSANRPAVRVLPGGGGTLYRRG